MSKLQAANKKDMIFDILNVLIMTALSITFIIPFIHIIFSSVSDPAEVMKSTGIMLWPKGFTLKGYLLTLSNRSVFTGYANTLFYTAVGTFANMICTILIAYVLSRKKVLFSNLIMFLLVFTMFFSGGLIPFYLQIRGLGLYNNRFVMILPELLNVMNVIIMRTSFMGIDEGLSDSAKIDGAGHFTILFKIILPVSKATLSVIALFYAVHHWNAWFNASIFLRDRNKYPLQLVLREILVLNDDSVKSESFLAASESNMYKPLVKYAVTVVATIPVLLIYPFIQKYFTQGVMIGSLKG